MTTSAVRATYVSPVETVPSPPIGPDGYYHPASEDDIRSLIRRASSEGRVVRVRGSAHSVHAAILSGADQDGRPDPHGINIMLDRLRAITFDDATMQVTVQAGCHLGRDPSDPTGTSTEVNALLARLDRRGWALPDTGGIIHQTISGFLATGSSGGSLQHSVGDAIVAIRLIDGCGRSHTLTAEGTPDLFFAAGVSMGLLGVIVAVTLQCVPSYRIIGEEAITTEDTCAIDLFGPGSDARPSLETLLRETEHARLFWWPQDGVRRVVVWQGRRMRPSEEQDPKYAKPRPYQQFPTIFGSSLPAQIMGGAFMYLIRYWNARGVLGAVTRAVLRLVLAPFVKLYLPLDGKEGPQRFWDVWWRALPMDNTASDRLFPTWFTEMWIPVSLTRAVMRVLREHFRAGGLAATGPYTCEIYATRRSRFWLSPAYEEDVVKVDMFWYGRNKGNPGETFYPQFWALLSAFAYRFHWGKFIANASASYLKHLYPRWDDFMRLRAELDPNQVFVSPYWRRHLGVPFSCADAKSLDLKLLPEKLGRVWGKVPDEECRTMLRLFDGHMVAENAQDIDGILETLVAEPRFVMEYLPFSLGRWSWWTRKHWRGRDAVVAFYRGFFRHFTGLRITILRYTLSRKGLVNTYRLEGRVFGGSVGPLRFRGIPVNLTMAAVFDYDVDERRFVGERVFLRERKALEEIEVLP